MTEPEMSVPDFGEPLVVHLIFLRVAATVSCAVGGIDILRGSSQSEHWDRLFFATAIAMAVLVTALSLRIGRLKHVDAAAAVVAICGMSLGIGAIERPSLSHTYWDGFGVSVLIASALFAVFGGRLLARMRQRRAFEQALLLFMGVLTAGDLVSLVRTSGYTSDPVNNLYALNELLAASAHRVADANFVPQYNVLYGYLLKPFSGWISVSVLAGLALLLLSVFAVGAVVVGVVIAHRLLGRCSLTLPILLVVPVTCVTVLHGAALQGSIASSIQELPIRLFPGMLYFLVGSGTLSALRSGQRRGWRLWMLGIAGGLIGWNSQDFGVAAVVAFGGVLLLVSVAAHANIRAPLAWLLGLAVGFVSYPVLTAFAGTPLSGQYVAFFDRTFGSGYGAAPIQIPGPVMVVLPVVLATAAIGCRFTLGLPTAVADERVRVVNDAAITAALFGTWSTLGFTYYLNRSFASGQLQVLLLPMAVGLVAVLSLAMNLRRDVPAENRERS